MLWHILPSIIPACITIGGIKVICEGCVNPISISMVVVGGSMLLCIFSIAISDYRKQRANLTPNTAITNTV